MDTHPVQSSWKWTSRHDCKARCTNRATRCLCELPRKGHDNQNASDNGETENLVERTHAQKAKGGTVSCLSIWWGRLTDSKTVKGMTRKDLQLDQLRRHSIRNYLVTDNIVHHCNWPDRVKANEKKKMKLCTLFISNQKLSCTMWCACHCSVDCKYEKAVYQWIRMFLFHFHSLVMCKEFF